MPEITLTYPVWDNLHLTQTCTTQFLHGTESDIEIIIIDNASTDGTWDWLSRVIESDDRVRGIHNSINVGYGPGLNQGLMVAKGEYMVALSNDVLVLHPRWLEILIQPLRENHKLLTGARMITTNANVSVNGWIPRYIEGFCMAFHKDFLVDVGFFDEEFAPAFVEDVELCWRAQENEYELYIHGDKTDTRESVIPLHHIYGQTTYETHRAETNHVFTTARNVAYFRDKVNRGLTQPVYPAAWNGGRK